VGYSHIHYIPILVSSGTFLSSLSTDLEILATTLGFINIGSAKLWVLFVPILAHEEYIAIFVSEPSTQIVFHAAIYLCPSLYTKFVYVAGTMLSRMHTTAKR